MLGLGLVLLYRHGGFTLGSCAAQGRVLFGERFNQPFLSWPWNIMSDVHHWTNQRLFYVIGSSQWVDLRCQPFLWTPEIVVELVNWATLKPMGRSRNMAPRLMSQRCRRAGVQELWSAERVTPDKDRLGSRTIRDLFTSQHIVKLVL